MIKKYKKEKIVFNPMNLENVIVLLTYSYNGRNKRLRKIKKIKK